MTAESRATLLDLAARVEAAAGADRVLSDEVLRAFGWRTNMDGIEGWPASEDDVNCSCWYPPGSPMWSGKWIEGFYRPNPLASLDAAAALVPEGWRWEVHSLGAALVSLPPPDQWTIRKAGTAIGCATPALALTAAALRARAEGAGDE